MHHFDKYRGQFPIWVAVEVMSFGHLSKLFMNLLGRARSQIAKRVCGIPQEYFARVSRVREKHVCSLHPLVRQRTKNHPRFFGGKSLANDRLLAAVYISKRLFDSEKDWSKGLVINLQALVERYRDDIDLSRIGFPQDWVWVRMNFPLIGRCRGGGKGPA